MNHKKLSTCVLSALFVMVALLLSACSCNHKWQEATCTTPKTCTLCGETEGVTRKHTWGDTTCTSPKPCTMCGTLAGIELTHQWQTDSKICTRCGYDGRPADIRFVESLSKGLDEALSIIPIPEDSAACSKEDWENYINAEYNLLIEFQDADFNDKNLGELANNYVDSIAASKEALSYYDTDQWEDQYLNGTYHERTAALYEINQMSPISVSEEHQDALINLLNNGETIAMVSQLFDQVKFFNIAESQGTYTYEATVENSTTLYFSVFSFDVNLLDEDGNIIATENTKTNAWNPGEKKHFKFSTKESFNGIEVKYANWMLF